MYHILLQCTNQDEEGFKSYQILQKFQNVEDSYEIYEDEHLSYEAKCGTKKYYSSWLDMKMKKIVQTKGQFRRTYERDTHRIVNNIEQLGV